MPVALASSRGACLLVFPLCTVSPAAVQCRGRTLSCMCSGDSPRPASGCHRHPASLTANHRPFPASRCRLWHSDVTSDSRTAILSAGSAPSERDSLLPLCKMAAPASEAGGGRGPRLRAGRGGPVVRGLRCGGWRTAMRERRPHPRGPPRGSRRPSAAQSCAAGSCS